AVEFLREAVRLKPGHAAAHNSLGVAHYHAGRRAEALASFRVAVRANPSYAAARDNLGVAGLALSERDVAFEQYRALKSLDEALAARLHGGLYRNMLLDVTNK
ncbi:MAG TPA: tetratricopeptide repeat protein, partial [Pyrinomonadaceae bacterium]|nr:tetratricopeptide repeat protein [Pyrinomonadaceae bacterium]